MSFEMFLIYTEKRPHITTYSGLHVVVWNIRNRVRRCYEPFLVDVSDDNLQTHSRFSMFTENCDDHDDCDFCPGYMVGPSSIEVTFLLGCSQTQRAFIAQVRGSRLMEAFCYIFLHRLEAAETGVLTWLNFNSDGYGRQINERHSGTETEVDITW